VRNLSKIFFRSGDQNLTGVDPASTKRLSDALSVAPLRHPRSKEKNKILQQNVLATEFGQRELARQFAPTKW